MATEPPIESVSKDSLEPKPQLLSSSDGDDALDRRSGEASHFVRKTPVGESLKDHLRQQLEYYFSRENLAQDPYLVSQMDSERFVSIDTICNFKKIKSLSLDKSLVVETMRKADSLLVNEEGTMVRPNFSVERTTLILREIPQDTKEEEIRSLFGEKATHIRNIHFDVGDNWFVTFATEDDCTDCALSLQGKTFKGNQIHCRVKSENLLRSFYTPNAAVSPINYDFGVAQPFQYTPHVPSFYPSNYAFLPYGGTGAEISPNAAPFYPQQLMNPQQQMMNPQQQVGGYQQLRRGERKNQRRSQSQRHPQPFPFDQAASQRKREPRMKKKRSKRDTDDRGNAEALKQNVVLSMNPSDFPELGVSNGRISPEVSEAGASPPEPADSVTPPTISPSVVRSRELAAEVYDRMVMNEEIQMPKSMEDKSYLVVVRQEPLKKDLHLPMPIFSPASPSPMLAARSSLDAVPSLDLATGRQDLSRLPPSHQKRRKNKNKQRSPQESGEGSVSSGPSSTSPNAGRPAKSPKTPRKKGRKKSSTKNNKDAPADGEKKVANVEKKVAAKEKDEKPVEESVPKESGVVKTSEKKQSPAKHIDPKAAPTVTVTAESKLSYADKARTPSGSSTPSPTHADNVARQAEVKSP
eukprot:221985_1